MTSISSSNPYEAKLAREDATANIKTGWAKVYSDLVRDTSHSLEAEKKKKEKLSKRLGYLDLQFDYLQKARKAEEEASKSTSWYLRDRTKYTWLAYSCLAVLFLFGAESANEIWSNTQNFSRPPWLIAITVAAVFGTVIGEVGDVAFTALEGRENKRKKTVKNRHRDIVDTIGDIRHHLKVILTTDEKRLSREHMKACIESLNRLNNLDSKYFKNHQEVELAIGILLQMSPDEELKEKLDLLLKTPFKSPMASAAATSADSLDKGKGPKNLGVSNNFSFLKPEAGDKFAEGVDTGRSIASAINSINLDNTRVVPKEQWLELTELIGTPVSSLILNGITFLPEETENFLEPILSSPDDSPKGTSTVQFANMSAPAHPEY